MAPRAPSLSAPRCRGSCAARRGACTWPLVLARSQTPQNQFNSFGSGGGSTSQPVAAGSATNSYPGNVPIQTPQLTRQPSMPLQLGQPATASQPTNMPLPANSMAPVATAVPNYQPLAGASGGHGAIPQATPAPVRMTLAQQYELLKAKKVKLTEKLCRFFKVLEARMEKQPMDATQVVEGKSKCALPNCRQAPLHTALSLLARCAGCRPRKRTGGG